MKLYKLLPLFLLLFSSLNFAGEWDDYNQINRTSALLIVEAFNKSLFTLDEIYSEISPEYRDAQNEFEKKKLESKYELDTNTFTTGIRKTNKLFVKIPIRLPEYNFIKKGFEINGGILLSPDYSGSGNGTSFSYQSDKIGSVSVDIDNFNSSMLFSISVQSAEKITSQLSNLREVNLFFYGTITKIDRKLSLYGKSTRIHLHANTSTLMFGSNSEIEMSRYKFKK